MVVGDVQVGKTTLLIRLLGVTSEESVKDAEDVLRAGREQGDSATPVPIRYRWSTVRDHWLLVRGQSRQPEWLESAELRDFLARYRSPEGQLGWHHSNRPLEIGLPTRLADERERRPELRVLDLPGLFARDQLEQEGAQAIVSRFAPLMSLIVFVQRADNIGDAFHDEVIRTNPYLTDWVNNIDHYRVVLTHAFSLETQQAGFVDRLTGQDAGARSPQAIATHLRLHLARQLADSLPGTVDAGRLANVLYPVELGYSWNDFARKHPRVAALVRPANELAIGQLGRSIEVATDEDNYHLHAPEIALRVAGIIRRQAADRAVELASGQQRLKAAAGQLSTAERTRESKAAERDQAADSLERLKRAVAALAGRRPPFDRPPEPAQPMKGHIVRALQEDERVAWYAAAEAMWLSWRNDYASDLRPASFPQNVPLSEDALRKYYADKKVRCCGECTENWLLRTLHRSEKPEYCYGRMTAAADDMTTWIQAMLTQAAARYLRPAEETLTDAETRLRAAVRQRDGAQRKVGAAQRDLQRAMADDKAARSRDRTALARVEAVTSVINRENQAYVLGLLNLMAAAPGPERGWYVIAVLRALYDLERMIKDT